jgi:hypothetical protein
MQISVAEGLEDFDDDLSKGVGNILREGPPGGGQQFLRRGIQLPQIGKMPTTLVGSRVELEVDLIIATDEADLERSAEVSNDQSFGHSHGKAEAKEVFVRRSVVEPKSRQAEFGPNGLGSGHQPLRQRTGAVQLAIFQRVKVSAGLPIAFKPDPIRPRSWAQDIHPMAWLNWQKRRRDPFGSPKTGRNHVSHIFAKLNVHTRTEAALVHARHADSNTGGGSSGGREGS